MSEQPANQIPTPSTRQVITLLCGFSLVGLILRLIILGDSLVYDEGSTHFVVYNRSFVDMLDYVRGEQEVSPPLFFIFSWMTQHLGDSPQFFRLPSLLAGMATIPLTYLLGLLTVGRKAGLVGSAIVAISPFMVYYSTEARPYALMMLTILVSSIALVKALRENRFWWWALFAGASAATMYTHYTGLFVLAGQFAWAMVFFPDRRRQLVLAGISAAILYIPWLSEYKADGDSPGAEVIGQIFPFKFANVPDVLAQWSYFHPYDSFLSIPGPALEILLGIGILLALVGLILKTRQSGSWKPDRMLLLVVVLALAAPVGTVLVSAVSVSVFLSRNQASSSVGLALLVGALVMAPRRRELRWIAGGLVVGVLTVGSLLLLDRENRRADYLGAVEYMSRESPGNGVIVDASDSAPAPTSAVDIAVGQRDVKLPVIHLGRPTREAQDALLQPGHSRYDPVAITPTPIVADESLKLAGPGGRIFLIYPSLGYFAGVRVITPLAAEFEQALGDRARPIGVRRFPGVVDGVYVRTFVVTGR